MKREFARLANQDFDLIIIGGGINGAASARDAAMRGLRVAVIDCADFGSFTSSNSAKIAHCGMRYLQHIDIKRMRESIKERNHFHQNAPHLVESQPFLMPIYGHGIKGKEVMTLYLKIYDMLSWERHQFDDPYRRVPDSSVISKDKVLEIESGIETEGLTGGAVWYEGQMQNTERLLLSLLKSADQHGAVCLNYAEATRIVCEGQRVVGVKVKDLLTGEEVMVSAKYVLNATGPWAKKIFSLCDLPVKDHGIYASKAFSLLTRPLTDKYALTFPIRPMYADKDAVVKKESSLQFAIPWRGCTMLASLHLPCDETPENVTITEEEIATYIERINEGYPGAKLTRSDVKHVLWGIIPSEGKGSAAPLKHYKIIDHSLEDGIEGLGTVIGVKYTTSRDVAEKTVDMVVKQLGQKDLSCSTADKPVYGGDITYFESFMEKAKLEHGRLVGEVIVEKLVKTYGTEYSRVLALGESDASLLKALPDTDVIGAQVVYAVREELATSLADVVFRRTDMGSLQYPGLAALQDAAGIMAGCLGWSEEKVAEEIERVHSSYLAGVPEDVLTV